MPTLSECKNIHRNNSSLGEDKSEIRRASYLSRLFRPQTGQTQDYTYDSLRQLLTEAGWENHTYDYDALYNRISKEDVPYSYNALNQLTTQGDTTYTYDPNGNLIRITSPEKTIHLHYDLFDRLILYDDNGTQTHYTYDAFHRRTKKDSEIYLYDHDRELGTHDTFRLLAADHPSETFATVAIEHRGNIYLPIHDPFGHLALLLDAQTGVPLERFQLTPYGEGFFLDPDGTPHPFEDSLSPWIVSSKRYDPESGHTLYGMRYYSPSLGRWLTPDPAGFHDGLNLYTYLHNNPLRYTDLYGLSATDFARGVGTSLAIGIGIRVGLTALGVVCPAAAPFVGYALWAHAAISMGSMGSDCIYAVAERGLGQAAADFAAYAATSEGNYELGAQLAGLAMGRVGKAKAGPATKTTSLLANRQITPNPIGAGKASAIAQRQLGLSKDLPRWYLPDKGGALIGNTWFTRHALERMAPRCPGTETILMDKYHFIALEKGISPGTSKYNNFLNDNIQLRGIPPMVVEAEIASPGSTNVRVVLNQSGDVVTAHKR